MRRGAVVHGGASSCDLEGLTREFVQRRNQAHDVILEMTGAGHGPGRSGRALISF